jgi:hypothetical protein
LLIKRRLLAEEEERELCEILMWCDNISEICRILKKHRQTIWRMMERVKEKMILAGISPTNQKKSKKNSKRV